MLLFNHYLNHDCKFMSRVYKTIDSNLLKVSQN